MKNRTQVAAPDIGFFRNTGLTLVFLTLMAGSISLIGSLAIFPSNATEVHSYGIAAVGSPDIMAPAD